MPQALAFGSYIPGTSPIHALNAQVKIILACVFSVCVFVAGSWAAVGVFTALVIALYAFAHVRVTEALRGLTPVLFILLFTVVVHAFAFDVDAALASAAGSAGSLGFAQQARIVGNFGVTLDGLCCGLFLALRIALLVSGCALLTFTTSMVEITDGLRALLSPLRRLRVPVDDVAMIVSIALRFIPTTAQEAQSIQLAQKARCADFDSGNVLKRTKAWVPVLVPLVVRLFRRAEELAQAMDARCYGIGERTHRAARTLRAYDVVTGLVAMTVLIIIAVVL